MCNFLKKSVISLSMLLALASGRVVYAEQIININASTLVPRAEISVTPAAGTFTEGSVFEVPILLNTKGQSMNAIELYLKYDPNKLSIVKPSTGKSIIGIWVQPPKYDNTNGSASFVGTVPGGIVSDSALIITITFQAKSIGRTEIRVLDSSNVLANDGLGTQAILTSNRGVYTVLPKPPGGLTMYSDTHPFQDHWYNNNNPTIGWDRDPQIIGFSYVLDALPNTIPPNENVVNETSKSYQSLNDGLWYFHIKALREGGAWGTTTNYIFRIDTTPPAKFKPTVDYLNSDNINRALVTFFSTDSLSGIDHYEIGVIDKTQAETASPIFVRSESPYQVPLSAVTNSRVIVRAYDVAGNSTDVQVSVRPPSTFVRWFTNNSSLMLLILLVVLVLLYLTHYIWGHKVVRKLQRVPELLQGKKSENVAQVEAVKKVEEVAEAKEEKNTEAIVVPTEPRVVEEAKSIEPEPEVPVPVAQTRAEPEPIVEVKPEPKVAESVPPIPPAVSPETDENSGEVFE